MEAEKINGPEVTEDEARLFFKNLEGGESRLSSRSTPPPHPTPPLYQ